MRRRKGPLWGCAVAAVLLLLALGPPPGMARGGRGIGREIDPAVTPASSYTPPPNNNISYNSSVDGFPLTYVEWLPTGYSPNATYPLAVFLHGVGTDTAPIPGGIGGENQVSPSLVDNASAYGFIMIGINTRTSSGFYINSPCGGPQGQDVLDAIAHEKSIRHISSVYLIGFSMGSLGAFVLAGHHPGMFAGIATAGSITDIYQTVAYNTATTSAPHGIYYDLCGDYPSPANVTTDRYWTYMSPLRFDPENFSGTPMFVSGGGADTRAPNNFAEWDYANVNNTFLNSTCNVVSAWGEPANCTVTIPSLAAKDPSAYRWLELYEPLATHSAMQFPGQAVFAFFLDEQAGGYYTSTFPGGVLTPYTPGTPIVLPSSPAPFFLLTLWTELILVAVIAAIAVVVVVAVRRRGP